LTFRSRSSATALTYLSRHLKARVSERTLRSSAIPLYWTSRSPGQTSRDEPFAVLRQLSGTRCMRQSLTVFHRRQADGPCHKNVCRKSVQMQMSILPALHCLGSDAYDPKFFISPYSVAFGVILSLLFFLFVRLRISQRRMVRSS